VAVLVRLHDRQRHLSHTRERRRNASTTCRVSVAGARRDRRMCGALTYSELAGGVPRARAASYVFVRESFAPAAFLFSWAELWVIGRELRAIGITASAYTLARWDSRPPPSSRISGPSTFARAAAGRRLYPAGRTGHFSDYRGAVLQNVSTAFKVGALALLVLVGFSLGHPAQEIAGGIFSQRAAVGLSPFLLAMVSILWAYDGWADLAFVGGEVLHPAEDAATRVVDRDVDRRRAVLSANLVTSISFRFSK